MPKMRRATAIVRVAQPRVILSENELIGDIRFPQFSRNELLHEFIRFGRDQPGH
jgi:hypothetical protein